MPGIAVKASSDRPVTSAFDPEGSTHPRLWSIYVAGRLDAGLAVRVLRLLDAQLEPIQAVGAGPVVVVPGEVTEQRATVGVVAGRSIDQPRRDAANASSRPVASGGIHTVTASSPSRLRRRRAPGRAGRRPRAAAAPGSRPGVVGARPHRSCDG
jgi:hypothetical protein